MAGFFGVLAKKGAPLLERLMARVSPEPNSGCWLWTGSDRGRYGMAFLPGGKPTGAHRAMLIAHGIDLKDSDVVCHKCDVPFCVNPDHLFVATQRENLADMCRKGRHVPAYVVTKEWRQKIREDATPAWAIALWFGISQKTVRNIRREL